VLNPTRGAAREMLERLDRGEVEQLSRAGVLLTDDRRRRPMYFDGRFLTARDLTREQNYFLTRLSDLGRSRGFGVVEGLGVELQTGSTIRIGAGHGVTPTGELVMLTEPLTLNVADLAHSQRLDAAFGLITLPRPPARNLSGLFVVALRPVEFTANPIASYPASVDGPRSVEDGDIIEATVVTLVPYQAQVSQTEPGRLRAQVAREVFVDGLSRGIPADALPLAMMAIERSVVRWIDVYLVRREAGSNHANVLGLGIAPRARREAHALQYAEHLHQVLWDLDRGNRTRRFAASQYFLTLPAFGELPTAAIDQADFSQIFFPPEIQVDLSVIPEDELPALMEEGLLLPPIDLTLQPEEQDSTSVMAVLPLPRPRLRTLMARLTSPVRTLTPSAPGMLAKRMPLESLRAISLPRLTRPMLTEASLVDTAWRDALSGAESLWYVRRRNVSYRADIVGVSVREVVDERPREVALKALLKSQGLTTRVQSLRAKATSVSGADLTHLLSSEKLAGSRTLTEGALAELEALPVMDRGQLLPVLERFSAKGTGEGIARLERVKPELAATAIAKLIASSKMVPELDALAQKLNEDQLAILAEQLAEAAAGKDSAAVAEVVTTWMNRGPQ
jgi:hypothetical protein